LFVNRRSGGGKADRAEIAERARERGIGVVVLDRGANVESLVGQALAEGADALGVAGGDGSLAVVAAACAANGLAFVCIPAGTRNHFARDLGVDPLDLHGALDAFLDGVERRIDVARVNGRSFLNNVSLGIYGDAVRRSEYRDQKVRTLLETVHAVLGPSKSTPELRLVDDLGREHRHPAVVVVSNNSYSLRRPGMTGARPSLQSGRLGVLVLDPPGARTPGRAWSAPSLRIDASVTVHAGIDGEAADLDPPLDFTIRRAVLRVRISSRHAGVAPAGTRVPKAS
jgi:diacylglycerol kinase family enzyme